MTASNKYMNSTLEAGGKTMAGAAFPGQILMLVGTYEKDGANDGNGSVLRFGTVPANAIPLYHLSTINNDALTGASDVDIGLYAQSNGSVDGAVVDKDILSDGIDISSGNALASPAKAFQLHPAIDEFGQDLRTLVGGAVGDGNDFYDVALTGNTFGTASGTIAWSLAFLLPQS